MTPLMVCAQKVHKAFPTYHLIQGLEVICPILQMGKTEARKLQLPTDTQPAGGKAATLHPSLSDSKSLCSADCPALLLQ